MTAYYPNEFNENGRGNSWVIFVIGIFLLLIILGGIYFSLDLTNSHSVLTHGEKAEIVRSTALECQEKPDMNPVAELFNPETNRTACVYFIEGLEKFGIHILENEREVTAFIKDKMKTLDQVINYLRNTGYQ